MRIGLFYDERLPYIGAKPEKEQLSALGDFADLITLDNYEEKLQRGYDCLVNLHGGYFLKSAWNQIQAHLHQGGGLVNIGAAVPFSLPVALKDGEWLTEGSQTAYHEALNIRSATAIHAEQISSYHSNEDLSLCSGLEHCFEVSDTLGLIVQFTTLRDVREDNGSSGPMDAAMIPLLYGTSKQGQNTAAPVVMIENTKGEYAGGRWIFVNQQLTPVFWKDGAELVHRLAKYAAKGVTEFWARPNYASYYPGEQPCLLLQFQNLKKVVKEASLTLKVTKNQETVYEKQINISISKEIIYESLPLGFPVEKGEYFYTAALKLEDEIERVYRNGFWGYDKELMASTTSVSSGRDYFYKDGKPMPVVGMTYMQSDVHRKFIYLPNVYLWDKDFSEMKQAGINMVRTGIWTAHRTLMFNDGIASEEILRALDAMFLTSARYDMPIVFNFFAFTPEVWEGVNPYLDPRSIQAQKRFISSVVSRYKEYKHVSWDLINEPALCTVHTNWRPVPNYDGHEAAAWKKWLKERHKDIAALQERWNCTPAELPSFESASLPERRDFTDFPTFTEAFKPLKVHDYVLFTQDIMNQWTAEMIKTIRAAGSKELVTVGQDEALVSKRPSPFFYQASVDYTTNHSWWQLDDLYWDSIFAKTPEKPNLIQETGIMYVQNANGRARRSEEELRDILERKYAIAFAGNNAGAVHWIWNVNVYMDSINEVNIGALRADGTQKREAEVTYDFGDFIRETGHLFENRKEEEVAVIFPYANNFSARDYASQATKKLTRILGYKLQVPFKAYGEYNLDALKAEKLIIIPSPRTISDKAWNTVLEKVKEGSTLLVTGPISYDEYWYKNEERSKALQISTELKNCAREEELFIGNEAYSVAFGRDKITWVDKEVETGKEAELKVISYGKGKVVWSPLPVEVNEDDKVTTAVYEYALKEANAAADFEWIRGKRAGILGKKLQFEKASVYVFVSESAKDAEVTIKDKVVEKEYTFTIPANRMMMFAISENGELLKAYQNRDIKLD